MIRTMPGSRHYGWWQFKCAHNHDQAQAGPMYDFVRGLVQRIQTEGDPVLFYALEQQTFDKKGYGRDLLKLPWIKHVFNSDPWSVHPILWNQSKTGEVNITEFKDKFKEAVSRFLAGAVEVGILLD